MPTAKKRKTTAKKPTMPTPPAKKRRTSATTMNKPAIPPAKKRKTSAPTPTQSTTPIPQSPPPESPMITSLPYDLLLSCIARVSRLYYPTLSLVSKGFRSLTASPELYKVRSLLGRAESCLYVCIKPGAGHGLTWYTLCRKPKKPLISETKPSGYVLAKVPIPGSSCAFFSGLVAVGSNIYNIGGSGIEFIVFGFYSRVWILDCRSHTWSEAPSLRFELCRLSASVIDGKIYVAGRSRDGGDSRLKNSFQAFDTKAQVWDPVPSEVEAVVTDSTASIEGKFHVVTRNEVVAYDPKEGGWDVVARGMRWYMQPEAYCVIDNVLYSAAGDGIRWYDTEARVWRDLSGLVGLPKLTGTSRVKLADYGGKMAVLWEAEECPRIRRFWYFKMKEIWCAEIALERRNSCEIWGKVEWLDHVLTVPSSAEVIKALAATL